MDLQYELGRVAQVNREIKVANARIAELASEASKLERIGQDITKIRQRSSVASGGSHGPRERQAHVDDRKSAAAINRPYPLPRLLQLHSQ
jgi:hypothetical protein